MPSPLCLDIMSRIKKPAMNKRRKLFQLLGLVAILVALPVTVLALLKYTPYLTEGLGGLTGTRANIVVNLTDAYPFVPPWAHLAQGGEEKTDMLSPVIAQTAVLQPQYIRLDHIFDFYDVVSRNPDGSLAFNWSKFDVQIDHIRKMNAKPFLSISYMPSAISAGSEIDAPRDWTEWQRCVQALVEHVSGKATLNMTDVYYEVWNAPDLFGKFTLGGEKDYLKLYQYASLGAVSAKNVNTFKFGGPATTGLYGQWVTNFLNFASRNNLRLDFYSWHRYSKVLQTYENDLMQAQRLIYEFPQYQNAELIISEAGYNSDNDKGNDGVISAIQTLGMYADIFQKIDRVFTFEIKDGPGPSQYWGRWGILTHEQYGTPIPKPRYLALEFLNKMRGSFYPVYGQGTWVKSIAVKSGTVIRVLLVNYDPTGKHSERVPVSFVNMPSFHFTYRRINFMGKTEERVVDIQGTNWNVQEEMGPNIAAILEISP